MDAYSEDLRKKIVEAVQQRRMNKSEAARAFGVSLSSVKRYTKAVREGRSLSPGKAPGKRPILDEKARRLLESPPTPVGGGPRFRPMPAASLVMIATDPVRLLPAASLSLAPVL
jgi:hypothetical protein